MDDATSLVSPMISALRRYARSLVEDRTEADALVRECLERTIARWHRHRAEQDGRTWIFATLHDLATGHLTRSPRRRAPPLGHTDRAAIAGQPDQGDRMRHAGVVSALGRLPEDQRAVLLLVSVEDMSYAQAAVVVGVRVGTVMSRLALARDGLRRDVGGNATPPPVLRKVR